MRERSYATSAESRAPIVILLVAQPAAEAGRLTGPLAALGFAIVVAPDGDQALSRFADSHADVVLIAAAIPRDDDYRDGYDICEKLQALPGGNGTPIVMLAKVADPEALGQASRAGATDLVFEPIDFPALAHRLSHDVRAARALRDGRESARRLHTAQRLARLAQWELDLTTRQFRWSTEAPSVFGISLDSRGGVEELLRSVHAGDRDRVAAAMAEPCSHRLEFRMVAPDQRVVTVHQEAEVVFDDLDGSIRLVGVAQDISELRRAELKLAYLDSLTGLPNRAFLHRFLGHALSAARRQGHPLAVLALDLDLFKRVNDTFGHAVGDALLSEVARRIQACIRSSDALAHGLAVEPDSSDETVASRLGGDEFVVVLSQLRRAEDAAVVAQRINVALAEGYDIAGHQVFISSSIGIAMHPEDGDDVDGLLDRADVAMYDAKESGKNTFRFFTAAIQVEEVRRDELTGRLRVAVAGAVAGDARGEAEFSLHYQPKLSLPDRRVTGVEALLRWRPAGGELVAPDVFIPIAETSGLILPLGQWVLRRACRQAAAWRAAGRPLPIAINVSPRQLRDPDFVASVVLALEEVRLPPWLLEIEVTESAAMTDESAGARVLTRLRQLGVRITLDDFGTGYSSLSWLARLPIDCLKIDRGFIHELGKGGKCDAVTLTIIGLAERLGIRIVAEGVETTAQLLQLEALRPLEVQGFLLARPMPERELAGWLAANDGAIVAVPPAARPDLGVPRHHVFQPQER